MAPQQSSGKKVSPMRAIIAGGITGGIEICITYPTEYIKTYMQLYPQKAKTMADVVSLTRQANGFQGLYRGLSALLFFTVPKVGSRFGANEFLKNNVFTDKSRFSTFMAGLGSGVVEAALVVTPAETLKVKLIHDKISQTNKYSGLFQGIGHIVKEKGFSGVYKGLMPTIVKQGSNQGIRFLVYSDSKKLIQNNMSFLPEPIQLLLAGGIAGAASVYANTPVDVVKTKMQGLDAEKYKGSLDCAKQIVAKDGFMGLYKGTVPRLMKVVIDVAITFTLYDYTTRLMEFVSPSKN